jgi:hypothetical protein
MIVENTQNKKNDVANFFWATRNWLFDYQKNEID